MLLAATGRDEVVKVATPLVVAAVPRVVEPFLKVTLPFALDETVAVSVTVAPDTGFAGAKVRTVELAVLDAPQAIASLLMSTDPRPVTRLYPVVASAVAAL